jgi:hypothetical protein
MKSGKGYVMTRPMSTVTLTAFLDGFALSGFLTRARWPGAPAIGFQPSASETDAESEFELAGPLDSTASAIARKQIAREMAKQSRLMIAEMMAEKPDLTIMEMKEILRRMVRESISAKRSRMVRKSISAKRSERESHS